MAACCLQDNAMAALDEVPVGAAHKGSISNGVLTGVKNRGKEQGYKQGR